MVSRVKKPVIAWFCLLLLSTACFVMAFSGQSSFERSLFNYSSDQGITLLSGEWEFYHQTLLEPGAFKEDRPAVLMHPVTLPGDLTKQYDIDGRTYDRFTYGTLRTTIVVDDLNKRYGVKAPYLSSANKIWVNGQLLAQSGEVSDNPLEFRAEYKPAEIFFTTSSEEIEIVAQIANFHHRRIRMNEVSFGQAEDIRELSQRRLIKESAISGGLFLVGIYYLIIYRMKQNDRASLYLSLLAFAVATRGLVLQEKIILHLFPSISGELLMKLGFLPVFLFLPLISLYLEDVFSISEISRLNVWLKKAAFFFVALVAVTPGFVYDLAFEWLQYIFIFISAYVIYIMFVKKYNKIRGFGFMLTGSVILFIAAVNDILREFDVLYTPELFSYGIFLFIVIQAVFLAWKYNDAYLHAEKLAEDNRMINLELDALNKELEDRIRKRTMELEIANQKLQEMSAIDSLTGLYNRRFFEQRYKEEWNRCQREEKPISVLMIDIDYFKAYNDNNGHVKGDDALISVASKLKQSLRRGADLIARYGGEEFIVLLPATDCHVASRLAEKIRASIEKLQIPHPDSKNNPFITISIGVCSAVPNGDSKRESLIKQADDSLYRAKAAGRNRVELCE